MSRIDLAMSSHKLAVSKREQLEKDLDLIETEEKELNEKVKTLAMEMSSTLQVRAAEPNHTPPPPPPPPPHRH
jgi:SMC interacting uncharacterized protein involved in chromosome segregation